MGNRFSEVSWASGTGLIPLLRALKIDQATQLSHTCRGPRSIPCRFPKSWSRVHELRCTQVSCLCGFPCQVLFFNPGIHLDYLVLCGVRNTYKNRDTETSCWLSKDGHRAWISSKVGNVVLDPVQCSYLVQMTPVTPAVFIACAVRQWWVGTEMPWLFSELKLGYTLPRGALIYPLIATMMVFVVPTVNLQVLCTQEPPNMHTTRV